MKTLVVYYSFEGNTKYAAELITQKLDSTVISLEPVKDYPRGNVGKFIWGGKAATFSEKPKLKPYKCSVDDYDMIIIGTPVWNSRITPPINTFLHENDIKDKVVAIFASSASGDAEKCISRMKQKLNHVIGTLSLINAAESKGQTEEKVDVFIGELKGKFQFGK